MVLEAKLWNLKKNRADGGSLNILDFDDLISTRALTKEDNKNIFAQPSPSTPKDSKPTDKKSAKDKKGPSVRLSLSRLPRLANTLLAARNLQRNQSETSRQREAAST